MGDSGATMSLIDHDVREFMAEHLIEELRRGRQARRIQCDLCTLRPTEAKRGAKSSGPSQLHLGGERWFLPECRTPVDSRVNGSGDQLGHGSWFPRHEALRGIGRAAVIFYCGVNFSYGQHPVWRAWGRLRRTGKCAGSIPFIGRRHEILRTVLKRCVRFEGSSHNDASRHSAYIALVMGERSASGLSEGIAEFHPWSPSSRAPSLGMSWALSCPRSTGAQGANTSRNGPRKRRSSDQSVMAKTTSRNAPA